MCLFVCLLWSFDAPRPVVLCRTSRTGGVHFRSVTWPAGWTVHENPFPGANLPCCGFSPDPPEAACRPPRTGRPAVEPRAPRRRVPASPRSDPSHPPEGLIGRRVTWVPVRLSAYPGFPIGVSFSTPAGYFTHLHRTEHDPTRVAPCCNLAWERTPGLLPLVSALSLHEVAWFGTPGAKSGSGVRKHAMHGGDRTERENRPRAFRPKA